MFRQQGTDNSAKYREVWKRLSGEGAEDLHQRALSRDGRTRNGDEASARIEEERQSRKRSRVDDILHKLESPEYQELSQMLRRDGERAWHPDLPRQ